MKKILEKRTSIFSTKIITIRNKNFESLKTQIFLVLPFFNLKLEMESTVKHNVISFFIQIWVIYFLEKLPRPTLKWLFKWKWIKFWVKSFKEDEKVKILMSQMLSYFPQSFKNNFLKILTPWSSNVMRPSIRKSPGRLGGGGSKDGTPGRKTPGDRFVDLTIYLLQI